MLLTRTRGYLQRSVVPLLLNAQAGTGAGPVKSCAAHCPDIANGTSTTTVAVSGRSAGTTPSVACVRGRGLSESSDTLDYSLDAWPRRRRLRQAARPRALRAGRPSMGARIGIRTARPCPARARAAGAGRPAGVRPRPPRLSGQAAWYIDSIRLMRAAPASRHARLLPTWTDEQLRLRANGSTPATNARSSQPSKASHRRHPRRPAARPVPTLLMVAGRGDVIRPEDRTKSGA